MCQDQGLLINVEVIKNLKAIWNVKQITEVLKPTLWLANWHCRNRRISTKSDIVSLQTRISHWTVGTCSHNLLGDGLRREKALKHLEQGFPLLKESTTCANEKKTRLFWHPWKNVKSCETQPTLSALRSSVPLRISTRFDPLHPATQGNSLSSILKER